jgi:dTDP-4-amino-4,6-dideoxygalactose transaminase
VNARLAVDALQLARRRIRWVVRPPRVRGRIRRPYPGAARVGRAEEDAAVEAVRELVRSKRLFPYYGMAPTMRRSRVAALEAAFARRIGAAHALAVNSGTSALICALAALEIGPGDEVIVPGYTWFSTVSAVMTVGAVPVVAEVDDSLTLDPADVERKLSPQTRCVIPVHMRGMPARMDALGELARARRLRVLEDVAQAAGGSFGGRALGSIGDAGAFSFQFSKVMTAGEGGMVATRDAAVHQRAAMYQDSAACPDLGVPVEDWLPGLNLRMSELHAAVLLVQLERVDSTLAALRARKRRLVQLLRAGFGGGDAELQRVNDEDGDIGIALVFFVPEPGRAERIVAALRNDNVPASRLYHDGALLPRDYVDLHAYEGWLPLLQKRTWSARGGPWRGHARDVDYAPDACPVTMDLLRRAIHVDVSAELTEEQVEQMAAAIVDAVARTG